MTGFGKFFKERRLALGLPLRRFCEKHGIDPSNLSKLERGRMTPPRGEKLHEYARCLELVEGTDDWYQFFDLAAAEAGRIPDDLQDEDIVQKLPVLFRTLRESARDGGDTDALIKHLEAKIRDA